MLLFLLAYLGGVLTIVSPCILPVLPFVFARADRPFLRSGLPMLAGMAVTFAAVATLAAVGGGWAVAGQPVRPLRRARAAGAVRPRAALPGARRAADAAARRAGRAAVAIAPTARPARGIGPAVAAARRRDRPALGALRRPDPRPDPDRRRAQGRQRRHLAAAARLCGGRGDVAGARAARRRTGVRRDEALARRRRMGAARPRAPPCWRPWRRSRSALDTGLLTRLSLASTASLEQTLLDTLASRRRSQIARHRLADERQRRDELAAAGDDDEGQAGRAVQDAAGRRRACPRSTARSSG